MRKSEEDKKRVVSIPVSYTHLLVFDGDVNFKSYFESVQCHGDYGTWLELAKKVRSGNVFPRLILAASFAKMCIRDSLKRCHWNDG